MLSFFHLRPSRLAAPLMLAAACAACSSSSPSTDEPVIVNDADTCDVVVSDADCDDTLRPLVFVHGTFGSGDNFALSAALFGSNGYCQDRIVALEYNSVTIANLSGGGPIDALDALIDEIRTKTGQDQVELLGHSQGTLHCTSYLNDPARAAKVAHYINLSGDVTVANDVKTLSISSNNDLQGTTHHATNAEKTVTLDDEDHMGVASSVRSFSAIYEYLLGKAPRCSAATTKSPSTASPRPSGTTSPSAAARSRCTSSGRAPRRAASPC